jgi:hypothetical protein
MLGRWARVLLLCLSFAAVARAEPAQFSSYEKETIERALKKLGGEIEPQPEGKIIEHIEIVTLEVIEDRDPVPGFFNIFHATTEKSVIRDELLFSEGERLDAQRVLESAKNLRARRQLSLVLILPLKSAEPNRVRMLVITKDVWSLRLNSNFEAVDGKLTKLLLQPAEENMFGTHKTVGALFILEPDTYSIGAQYIDRRVAGSRIEAVASANLIVNRESGAPEGSFGTFTYGQPLYSAESRWAWKTLVIWYDEVFRSYVGTDLRTYDAPSTAADDAIPYVYDAERWFGAYALTRSYGRRHKHDVSVGMELDRRKADAPIVPGVTAAARADFVREEVPVSDTRLSPFLELRSYTSEYKRVLDFETLGLQEDFRLGHEAVVRVYPASTELVSSRDLIGTYAALGYTFPLGDGLLRLLGANTVELARVDAETDAIGQLSARVVTPRLVLGRFIYDGVVVNHYKNYLNDRLALGGDTRLRGYAPKAFLGKDAVAQNIEFRTRPLHLLSVLFGAAVFYDTGDAFDGFSDLELKQSTGLGLRAVFPQAQRVAFRADWGFPIVNGQLSFPGSLFVTFGQAFDMPNLPAPSLAAEYGE